MNDLELLATLAEDTRLPSAADLAAPRARLTAAIATETGIAAGAARGRPGGRAAPSADGGRGRCGRGGGRHHGGGHGDPAGWFRPRADRAADSRSGT
jgi:hypothetical protein